MTERKERDRQYRSYRFIETADLCTMLETAECFTREHVTVILARERKAQSYPVSGHKQKVYLIRHQKRILMRDEQN